MTDKPAEKLKQTAQCQILCAFKLDQATLGVHPLCCPHRLAQWPRSSVAISDKDEISTIKLIIDYIVIVNLFGDINGNNINYKFS